VTDRGLNSWTDGLSARERIREIALTLTQPRSLDWISDEAHVASRETTKAELETLVESGKIRATNGDNGETKYAPNYEYRQKKYGED
jgi:hypothetical protein